MLRKEFKHLREQVRHFVENEVEPLVRKIDETGLVPEHIIKEARDIGLFGLSVPEGYGGMGLSTIEICLLLETIGYYCPALASLLAVHNCLVVNTLNMWGTESQKVKYLSRLANGSLIGGYALPEFNAYSKMSSGGPAIIVQDGRRYLQGIGRCVVNGPVADLIVISVENEGDGGNGSVVCLIEKDYRSCTVGIVKQMGGLKGFPVSEIVLDRYPLTGDEILEFGNTQEEIFFHSLTILHRGMVSLAACWVGIARRLVELCTSLALREVRRIDNLSSRERCWLLNVLGRMYIDGEALYGLVREAARKIDEGEDGGWEGFAAKVKSSEKLEEIVKGAFEFYRSCGESEKEIIERLSRDARAVSFLGGGSGLFQFLTSELVLKI